MMRLFYSIAAATVWGAILKLFGLAVISWRTVFLPVWGSMAIILAACAAVLVAFAVAFVIDLVLIRIGDRKRRGEPESPSEVRP